MSTTEMPSTFRCDCCGAPTPLDQAIKPYDDSRLGDVCLGCDRMLVQTGMGEMSAARDVLAATVTAALAYMAPNDVSAVVTEAIVAHSKEFVVKETGAEMRRLNARNLARREAI